MNYFKGKVILIIGGTGTIGKKLITYLANKEVKVIRVFSRDEYKQFKIQKDKEFINLKSNLRFLIGDVRDYERVERAMQGVDIVFNLAAMKHVDSCEYNPTEAIKTNIDGMNNVIKAATKHNIECVLFTSSDKAINPVNTYGATKMLAEKLIQAADYSKGEAKTKFIAVRFGNVMGSRGSVIPLFKKQILKEKRVTITDASMSRFMMSQTNAIELMLEACEKSIGGELFVLKMPVINIGDLTDVVVEEVCKKYDIDPANIKKEIIGAKLGEKNFEELMTLDEAKNSKTLEHMYVVIPQTCLGDKYKNYYSSFSDCEVKSYSSYEENSINKEKIRNLILEDNLI